jgi:hypothetical protein
MSLGNLLQRIDQAGLELKVQGFFNVESGGFGIGNDFLPYCDCVSAALDNDECRECERWFANFISFPSGDGDGIYVAAAIVHPSEPNRTLGLLAIFDYRYQMAAYARQMIESEQVPDYPIDLAMQFEDALAYKVGGIIVKETLLIGDKHFSQNGSYAVVDFPNPVKGGYKCFVYCQQVDPSPEATLSRLCETQGLDRAETERLLRITAATFEKFREDEGLPEGSNSLPDISVRAAVAFSDELSDLIEPDEFDIDDLNLLSAQFTYGAINTSHRQQMTDSVIWQNSMLAREWDRAAGDIDNDTAKVLLFDLWTWLYQGRELGSEDCANYLKNFKYQPTVEEQIYLLVRRGMFEAASRLQE